MPKAKATAIPTTQVKTYALYELTNELDNLQNALIVLREYLRNNPPCTHAATGMVDTVLGALIRANCEFMEEVGIEY